jgi:hypothetical protein
MSTAHERAASDAERPLVVVTGASNVALALPHVVTAFAERVRAPFDLVLAHGHGRSYGVRSHFLARELPPILDCGLWSALERARGRPLTAVLSDIGNDIVYGSPPELVARWASETRARLVEFGARVTLVGVPRARLERVTPFGFFVLRSVFFARHRITHATARAAAFELDTQLAELGRGSPYIEPPSDWYGLDPIHVRRGARRDAWRTIASAALPAPAEQRDTPPLTRAELRALARMCAEQRTLFGRVEAHAQPAVRLADGSTVAWY